MSPLSPVNLCEPCRVATIIAFRFRGQLARLMCCVMKILIGGAALLASVSFPAVSYAQDPPVCPAGMWWNYVLNVCDFGAPGLGAPGPGIAGPIVGPAGPVGVGGVVGPVGPGPVGPGPIGPGPRGPGR